MTELKLTLLALFVLVSTTSARLYFETHYNVRCPLQGIYDMTLHTSEMGGSAWPMKYELITTINRYAVGIYSDYKSGYWSEWVGYVFQFHVSIFHNCLPDKGRSLQGFTLNCTVVARDEDRVCAVNLDADLQ